MNDTTTKSIGMLLAGLILGISASSFYFLRQSTKPIRTAACKVLGLNQILRKLWSDHIFWTRQFIVSTLAELPDAGVTAKRLMKNQEDIGNAIAQYFGAQAGTQLTNLLKEHIAIAADLVKYAKENNSAAFKIADEKWHKNAADIATFLHNADSLKSYEMLFNMLNDHLALTTKEVSLRLSKNWQDDITNFEKIYDQGLSMADSFTDIITEKFPAKF